MRAPTMEADMKEEIRKSHEHRKTKEVFSFDDGPAEQQGPFLTVSRPILAALMNLDSPLMTKGKGDQTPRWFERCWRMLWFCWAMQTPV